MPDGNTIREHYERARPVYEALARVRDYPTIGNNDFIGWYIKRDTTDPEAIEEGYHLRGRVAQLDRDLDELLDRLERTLYAITTYKTPDAFTRWEDCRIYNGQTHWRGEKPTPNLEHLRAVPAWGDVDLVDDLKAERDSLDDETKALIEQTLAAYVDEFAALYGDREAVYALDSIGGAYIFGAPEATLPIAEHFETDPGAIPRVYGEFIDRSNEWLEAAQERVEERIDGAADVISPDWVNNLNRQYKAPLSLHSRHDAVVTPLDPDSIDYSPTPFDDVDDDLVDDATAWAESFTAIEHTDLLDHLVAELWPEEYEAEGSWQPALEAWVETERREEEEQARRRREALIARERRQDEGIEGLPITPHIRDVYDAVDALDIQDVAEKTIVYQWTDQASGKSDTSGTGKRAFVPVWGRNANGTANYINIEKGTWVDTGQNHHGTAVEMALIAAGGWTRGEIASGEDWARGVDELRKLGFEIPVWTPQAGTPRPDGGEYDQMPYWALRRAAIALGVAAPDDLVEREGDDGDTYLGLPGNLYDEALGAIADAGLDHGREPIANEYIEELEELLDDYLHDDGEPTGRDRWRIGHLLGRVSNDDMLAVRDVAADVLDTTTEAIDRHVALERYRAAQETDVIVEGGKTWYLAGVPKRKYEILNFEIDVKSFLEVRNEPRRADLEIKPPGRPSFRKRIEPKIFNQRVRFDDEILSETFGLTFDPGNRSDDEVLDDINVYINVQDAPTLTGTHHLGLHGDEWVVPDGSLTDAGWTSEPETVYLERNIGIERRIALPRDRDDYDPDDVATILRELPHTRPAQRFLPVIAWFYAAPFRPHIYDLEGEFNLLNVTGDTGSGKTTSLRYLWRCFGMRGEPFSCGDTTFAHTVTMGATNSWPVWYDEYKPSEMENWQVRSFHNLIRKAATGAVEQRGNPDQSTTEYELHAPLVISGEQQIQTPAERRRSLLMTFRADTTDDDSGYARAYKELVGEAFEDDGELEVPDDCPDPDDHALAYYRFVAGKTRDEIAERWQDARERLIGYRQGWDWDLDLDDLEIQALQTVIFGWTIYCEFAAEIGVDAGDLPGESDLEDALREAAGAVGPEGRRLSHMDQFLELVARAAARGALERGQEYELVREGREDEELRFHISKTYDAISKYVREHDLAGEDLLGSAADYRKRLKEGYESADDMVVSYSQKTPGVGKCIGIATRTAADRLDFDRSAFGAVEEPDEDDANDLAIPIIQLEDTRGYKTITATVVTWDTDLPDGAPEASGVVQDRTGAVNAVCWFDTGEFDVTIEEDRTYRFENANVGEYAAAPQIELNPAITSVAEIQQGAGHTGAAETEDGQGTLAANGGPRVVDGGEPIANGGDDTEEAEPDTDSDDETAASETEDGADPDPDEIEDARGKLLEYIRTSRESGDVLDQVHLTMTLEIPPSRLDHALERLRESGQVIEEDGEYRVT